MMIKRSSEGSFNFLPPSGQIWITSESYSSRDLKMVAHGETPEDIVDLMERYIVTLTEAFEAYKQELINKEVI